MFIVIFHHYNIMIDYDILSLRREGNQYVSNCELNGYCYNRYRKKKTIEGGIPSLYALCMKVVILNNIKVDSDPLASALSFIPPRHCVSSIVNRRWYAVSSLRYKDATRSIWTYHISIMCLMACKSRRVCKFILSNQYIMQDVHDHSSYTLHILPRYKTKYFPLEVCVLDWYCSTSYPYPIQNRRTITYILRQILLLNEDTFIRIIREGYCD